MKDSILRWLIQGQVGISSKAMASAILGIELTGWHKHHNHPRDPDDFNRCLLFLLVVPEARDHMDKIRKLSPVWNALIDHWNEIEKSFLLEVGLNWEHGKRAAKTYDLMQKTIEAAL